MAENVTHVFETKADAIGHYVIIPLTESGDASVDDYDIEAIVDEVIDCSTNANGRNVYGLADDFVDQDGYGDADAFWAVVARHERP